MGRISLFEQILSTKNDDEVSKQNWVENKAIKLLAKDPRSEHELREELKNAALKNAKKVGPLDEKIHIEPAFDRLRKDGLLSQDRRSIEILLDFYPHKGISFFEGKLRPRGIDKTKIRQVMLEKQYPSESERAFKVAQERMVDLKQDDSSNLESILETMPTFLSGRGFTEAAIRPSMDRIKKMCLDEIEEGMDTSNKPSW